MISLVLLGTGNVAKHLFDAFHTSDMVKVVQVLGRSKAHLEYFRDRTETSTNFKAINQSDILLIAVSDDAIGEVSDQLEDTGRLVLHTSGSVAMHKLSAARKGVFYPLQTFSQNRAIDFKQVPICIESSTSEDIALLRLLAKAVSEHVVAISSQERRRLHVAAVFVNNFTNHLYHMAATICEENKLPFSLLRPLIDETAKKVLQMSPKEAQTGPARRNDQNTITEHLGLLKRTDYQKIYGLLTQAITKTYEKEL